MINIKPGFILIVFRISQLLVGTKLETSQFSVVDPANVDWNLQRASFEITRYVLPGDVRYYRPGMLQSPAQPSSSQPPFFSTSSETDQPTEELQEESGDSPRPVWKKPKNLFTKRCPFSPRRIL